MAPRGRPLYEDRDARISILAAAKAPTCRIRLCRLFTSSPNRRLQPGRAIRWVLCRAAGANGSAVDTQVAGQFRLRRECGKDASPQATMARPVEPVADRRRRAMEGWAMLPSASDPRHMDDATDDAAIIHPPRARPVARQKRLNRRPRPVRKPKSCRDSVPPSTMKDEPGEAIQINKLIEFEPWRRRPGADNGMDRAVSTGRVRAAGCCRTTCRRWAGAEPCTCLPSRRSAHPVRR